MNHCVARTALIYVACLFTFASNAHTAEFFGLGLGSTASAISSDGTTIIGQLADDLRSYDIAFRWTREDGDELLPGSWQVRDVSGNGSIIVGGLFGGPPLYWTSETGTLAIANPPTRGGSAAAISDDGSVITGTIGSVIGGPYYARAFRWSSEAGLEYLTPALTDAQGDARDVSADGAVIVGSAPVPGDPTISQAFRWTGESGITDLGVLPGDITSYATAVSADGSVVVGASRNEAVQAFRWTADEGMTPLGRLPGHHASAASVVSHDGSFVLGISYGALNVRDSWQAFVWDEEHGMKELQQVLSSEHGLADQLSGWQLFSASGISADARTIVGTGSNPARGREAWVAYLDVPLGGPQSLLMGDFNNNGLVEQADLDLVLGNWGAAAANAPPTWTNDLPSGVIDQAELDKVLANWGNTTPGAGSATAIPEPGSVFLLLSCLIVSAVLRRGDRR